MLMDTVGNVTMPVTNVITIYHTPLRPLLATEGLWEQISDHETEVALGTTVKLIWHVIVTIVHAHQF